MFFRLKKSGERAYVQIVENKRVDGAVRQSVVATLGRADELEASGALASLLASGAKLTDQVMLITALDQDEGGALSASAKCIGGPLLFGKIWERLGVGEVLSDLLVDRAFEFSVERAIFVATLHRLFVPLQAVLRYRDLLQVEELFRRTKAIMRTRPIFHSSDAAIRGHVFCSFLALAMQKHLEDLMREAKIALEWKELLRDLDRLQQIRIQHRGADWLVRTDAAPSVTALFRAAHVALPPRARQTAPPKPQAPPALAKKRRGRPKRGATPPQLSPQIAQYQKLIEIRCSSRV